jgi:hypothetical protein
VSLYKICKAIDLSSQKWRDYCAWRGRDFTSFDSLDSPLRNSSIDTEDQEFWNYFLSSESYLSDIVTDFDYAKRYAQRCGADEILIFDFSDRKDTSRHVVGYEILDGAFRYSLLTNFGNDIAIVNDSLGPNGLIQDEAKAREVHAWFKTHMPEDPHVIGSKVFAVYEKFTGF